MAKTNTGLVDYAQAQVGLPYWYGTFGQTATSTLLAYKQKQYPSYYSKRRVTLARANHLGKRVHDCVGLIKGYLWSKTPTSTPKYNADEDWSADGTYNRAKVKGTIKTMPDIIGLCVRYKGHVGIYIGGGKVIEARGFDYGVVVTELSKRKWTHWYKHPLIEYTVGEIEAGDKVRIVKGAVYGGQAKGVKVPSRFTDGDVFTVTKVQVNNKQKEALLKELVSWVPVKYLDKVVG